VIIVLTIITAIPVRHNTQTGKHDTVLNVIGQAVTPAFHPMGIEKDNWQATVALLTGIFAKEAIVGTFEALHEKDAQGRIHETNFTNIHQVVAFLLFILIYAPCVAAMAVTQKEGGTLLATVQIIYLTILAWIVATVYYNIAVFSPLSVFWFMIAAVLFTGILFMFKYITIMKE